MGRHGKPNKEPNPPNSRVANINGSQPPTRPRLSIFISHTHADTELAGALVDYLVACLGIVDDSIRCSSQPGMQGPPGSFPDSLRNDLQSCETVFVLVTHSSLKSDWVHSEVGAAWVLDKTIIPVLIPGIAPSQLGGPIGSKNRAVVGSDATAESTLADLVCQIAETKGIIPNAHGRASDKLKKFMSELHKSALTPAPSITKTLGKYCEMHVNFGQRARGRQNGDDDLVLFCTYFDVVDNMELCQAQQAVRSFFELRNHTHSPVLWSLLGSMEMAVTFRSESSDGRSVQQALMSHIGKHRPKLETIKEKQLELSTEFIWDNGYFRPGRRAPGFPNVDQTRSTHAFIKLEHRDDQATDEAIAQVQKLLADTNTYNGGDINVDLYAISACRKFVIIELQFPCGQRDSIKILSKALESVLAYWNKDTFFVYDVVPLGPTGSFRGSNTGLRILDAPNV